MKIREDWRDGRKSWKKKQKKKIKIFHIYKYVKRDAIFLGFFLLFCYAWVSLFVGFVKC